MRTREATSAENTKVASMAYDSEHLKLTWKFSIAFTDEIAETSVRLKPAGIWSGAEAALDALKADLPVQALLIGRMATLMGNVQLQWADYSSLNSIRIAAVSAPGSEIGTPLEFEDTTPAVGLVAATTLPQSSVVVSLRSGLTTGAANFGKMYLPHTQLNLAPTSATATATATLAVVTAARVFLNGVVTDVNTIVPVAVSPFIMTQVAGQSSKAVTRLMVGNVTDTQRRRRNQIDEIYSALLFP